MAGEKRSVKMVTRMTCRSGEVTSARDQVIWSKNEPLTAWIPKFRRLIPSGTRGSTNVHDTEPSSLVQGCSSSRGRKLDVSTAGC